MKHEMHTPGPWRLDEYKRGRRIVVEANPPIPIQIFRNRANALLCAAAPELLEACKAAIKVYGRWDDAFSRKTNGLLRAAIAKAEGKP